MVVVFVSCKTSTEKYSGTTEENLSPEGIFLSMQDSIKNAWQVMIADDDEKHFHISRLLDELLYAGNIDSIRIDSLRQFGVFVVSSRYDQQSMAESWRIDRYDSLNSVLINRVINLAYQEPEFDKYPLMQELIIDIQEADNRVLMHRIHYDNFVFNFNQKLSDNNKEYKKVINKQGLEPMPVFTLSQ
jgi:hypothetical protein